MIRFSCSRKSADNTPVLRDIDIARYAQSVLYDYRPEFFRHPLYEEDFYEPELLDPYDFAEKYLDATVDIQHIYTDDPMEFIAGAAVFNLQNVRVFDKANMCTMDILVPPNTILLDNRTVHGGSKSFENFTIMHEAGHLLMHQAVYKKEPSRIFYVEGIEPETADTSVLCRRSNIGCRKGKLVTGEDFREHQANTFAASMLMPPALFIPYVQSLISSTRYNYFDDELMITHTVNDGTSKYWRYRDIVKLTAEKFGVSRSAVDVQLNKYGLVAWPKEEEVYEARRRLKMYKSLWQ